MRPDVKKCITERPRTNSRDKKERKGYRKQQQKAAMTEDCEGFVKRESIMARTQRSKDFTDVLGPLYGFLEKSVGRKWSDVCHEISEVLPASGGMSLIHARGHLFDAVQQHTQYDDDGELLDDKRHPIANVQYPSRRADYYVCPKGILRKSPPRVYRPWGDDAVVPKASGLKTPAGEYIIFDKWHSQLWFACTVEKRKPSEWKLDSYGMKHPLKYPAVFDALHRGKLKAVNVNYAHSWYPYIGSIPYGDLIVCVSKRQMGKRELKKYKLSNPAHKAMPERVQR